jgi:hypothetical protein
MNLSDVQKAAAVASHTCTPLSLLGKCYQAKAALHFNRWGGFCFGVLALTNSSINKLPILLPLREG